MGERPFVHVAHLVGIGCQQCLVRQEVFLARVIHQHGLVDVVEDRGGIGGQVSDQLLPNLFGAVSSDLAAEQRQEQFVDELPGDRRRPRGFGRRR